MSLFLFFRSNSDYKFFSAFDMLKYFDFFLELMDMRFEKDETKKSTLKEQFKSETLPFFCKKWDAQAGQNGGYIALKKVLYPLF